MTVLVTGGAGYIGSHVTVALMARDHDVLIVDNFCNSRSDVIDRIERIAGRRPRVIRVDVRDHEQLTQAIEAERLTGVIHLAGLKSVADSVRSPLSYFRSNVSGTINVREAAGDCPFVFSSSATVYGEPRCSPIAEDHPCAPVNPYGRSKAMSERVLIDASAAADASPVMLLRYFNPAGAHPSGFIGDDPRGTPQNLMPRIEAVAVGADAALTIHGMDYETRDGTAIRDYVHVVDLAEAHVRALEAARDRTGAVAVNIGSESGYSVLEMVHAFEDATGIAVPWRAGPRRAGDIAAYWASRQLAVTLLGWRPERSLGEMCTDALRWKRYAATLHAVQMA